MGNEGEIVEHKNGLWQALKINLPIVLTMQNKYILASNQFYLLKENL